MAPRFFMGGPLLQLPFPKVEGWRPKHLLELTAAARQQLQHLHDTQGCGVTELTRQRMFDGHIPGAICVRCGMSALEFVELADRFGSMAHVLCEPRPRIVALRGGDSDAKR